MTQPNILWICSDQQRYDTLGCTGNPWVRTPNLDRLASCGVLFDRCYTQSPVCTPSRAGFLTGRYPRTTRCRQNGQSIPADEVLVPKVLSDAGYVCGLSGKLHLSPCHPRACRAMERRIDDGYAVFHWSHHPAREERAASWPGNEYGAWLKEQNAAFERKPFRGSRYVRQGPPEALHQTTWCVQKAITFIERAAAYGEPWLFSVNMFDPHHAFDPPAALLERYAHVLDDIPLPAFREGELAGKSRFQRMDHRGAYNNPRGMAYDDMTESDHRLVRAAYWAMVDLIDRQVGRLLTTLETSGQLENTVVIFTSDHGEMLGDHGIYLKGPHFYEPAVRVPLIVAGPGVQEPGRRTGALVELDDLAPTVLDLAGVDRPAGMQARSLLDVLEGGDAHRADVYCEYYNAMPWHRDPEAHATMVRTDRHKLVVYHGIGEGELYDLTADPGETRNLWNEPAAAGAKTDMLVRLCDRMAWTVDPLPEREGDW